MISALTDQVPVHIVGNYFGGREFYKLNININNGGVSRKPCEDVSSLSVQDVAGSAISGGQTTKINSPQRPRKSQLQLERIAARFIT